MTRLRETVRQWKVDAARQGKPLKLPTVPFLLRNIWSGAMLLYALLTFSTLFIKTVTQVKCLRNFSFFIRIQIILGNNFHQSRWHLLGSCDVGPIRNHHGGRSLVVLPLSP